MKKINVGVIGLGVGERHLETLTKSNFVNNIKIFDIDKRKKNLLSKKFDVESCENLNQIFKDNKISLIIDSSYDNHHYEHIVKSIKTNKSIFVEKPAFQFINQAKKCARLLKKNKKIFFGTNYILRASPRFKKLKKMIKKKFLGDIYHFEGDYNYGRLKKLTNGWRGKIPYYSITLGGGIHIIDIASFLIDKKITEVKSFSNKIVTKKSSFKFDDNVISILKFEGNILGKISSNFSCVYPHFHKINIYGSKKTFENFNNHAKLYIKRNTDDYILVKDKYKPADKSEILKTFLKDFINNRNREYYLKQVLNTMSVGFAIEQSLKLNKTIKVKYIK